MDTTPTTTKRRKATATYRTEKGNLLEAVRSNPEHRSAYGRRYDVLVNGERVGTIVQTSGGHYTWAGFLPAGGSYLASGLNDLRLLYSAACSMANRSGEDFYL